MSSWGGEQAGEKKVTRKGREGRKGKGLVGVVENGLSSDHWGPSETSIQERREGTNVGGERD